MKSTWRTSELKLHWTTEVTVSMKHIHKVIATFKFNVLKVNHSPSTTQEKHHRCYQSMFFPVRSSGLKLLCFHPSTPPRHLFLDISVGQPSSYFILREWEGGVGDFAHDWGNSWQNKKWGQNSAQNEICSCSLPPAHKTAVRVLRSDEAINSGACFILHTIPWSVPPSRHRDVCLRTSEL